MPEYIEIFTGERALPLAVNMDPIVMAEHHCRYQYANNFSNGHVLDVACGVGYGTQMLASCATTVTGVDLSPAAIEYARKTYNAPNIHFLTADICQLPFADRYFDVIVSFETIEHIADGSVALKEMQRLLKSDGILVFSVPLGGDVGNKYHLSYYQRLGFKHFVRKFFRNVTIMYQNLSSISCTAISPPLSRSFPGEYIVAICQFPYANNHSLYREMMYQNYRMVTGAYAKYISMSRGLKRRMRFMHQRAID